MLTEQEGKSARLRYARKNDVTRSIEAARTAGVAISAVELGADGTIRLVTDRLDANGQLSEFDRLEALGKL